MRQIRLLTRAILDKFATMVYANRERIYRVWIVSPWIGAEDAGVDPFLVPADRGTPWQEMRSYLDYPISQRDMASSER